MFVRTSCSALRVYLMVAARCGRPDQTRMSMIMWQWQIGRFVLLLQHRISKTKHATRNYLHFNKTVRFMWLTLMSLPKQTVNLDDSTIGSRSHTANLYTQEI